jgi:pilus assembly protein Flp/PilA
MRNLFNQASAAVSQFINDDEAATAVEYALMASLIAAAIYGAVTALGGSVTNKFNEVKNDINTH